MILAGTSNAVKLAPVCNFPYFYVLLSFFWRIFWSAFLDELYGFCLNWLKNDINEVAV